MNRDRLCNHFIYLVIARTRRVRGDLIISDRDRFTARHAALAASARNDNFLSLLLAGY